MSQPVSLGIPAHDLSDQELERELAHTHRKRHDTFMSGSAHALATHTRRMFELELEYLQRFPERVSQGGDKLG